MLTTVDSGISVNTSVTMGNKDLDHLPYKNGRGVGVRGCLPLVWLTPFLPSSLSFSLAKPTHLSLHNEEETDKDNCLSLLGIILLS